MTDILPPVAPAPVTSEPTTAGRAPGLALPAFVAAIGLLVGSRPLSDNSFLTHLATGRLILDGGFPHADPYTFTAGGEPWVVQSWLASVLYGVADRLGDLGGVRLLVAATVAALAVVTWRLTRPAGSPIARLLVWAPVVVVGSGFWVERPLTIGLLLLGVVLVAAGDDGRFDRRWLLPVGWVWLNVHGSWPLGLVALVLLGAGRRLDGDRDGVRAVVATATWLVGGLLFGCVNPYGPRLLVFPVELLGRREALSSVVEWQAPRFTSPSQLAFLAVLGLAVVALTRRPSWTAALPLAGFTAAALVGSRNLPVATVVLLPGIAGGFAGLPRLPERLDGRQARLVAGAGLAMAAVAAVGMARTDPFDGSGYPVEATRFLDEAGLAPDQVTVIAQDAVGNWFDAVYGAGAGTFIDDRVEVTPPAVFDDYLELLGAGEGWAEVLDRYGAEVVLWAEEEPLVRLLDLSAGWERAYEDDRFVVFVRQSVRATAD